MNNLLSVSEFATLHSVSHQAIYYKIKTNQIKYIMIGKTKFIDKGSKYKKRAKNNCIDTQQVKNKIKNKC
jgi:predicted DNA-binding protein YlxM (UPF0122 family)